MRSTFAISGCRSQPPKLDADGASPPIEAKSPTLSDSMQHILPVKYAPSRILTSHSKRDPNGWRRITYLPRQAHRQLHAHLQGSLAGSRTLLPEDVKPIRTNASNLWRSCRGTSTGSALPHLGHASDQATKRTCGGFNTAAHPTVFSRPSTPLVVTGYIKNTGSLHGVFISSQPINAPLWRRDRAHELERWYLSPSLYLQALVAVFCARATAYHFWCEPLLEYDLP